MNNISFKNLIQFFHWAYLFVFQFGIQWKGKNGNKKQGQSEMMKLTTGFLKIQTSTKITAGPI